MLPCFPEGRTTALQTIGRLHDTALRRNVQLVRCLMKACWKAHNRLPSGWAHTFPKLAPVQGQLPQ